MRWPRQILPVYLGNDILYRCTPTDDADNGPKPKAPRITKVIGSEYLQFTWEVECAKVHCEQGNPGPVLHNRWSVTETFDQNLVSTRTYRGKLRVAGNAIQPHSLRHLCVPPLQPTFVRQSMEFTADATGLNLDYVITDRQVHRQPPFPARTWRATHSIVSSDGISASGNVHVSMEGPPGSDTGAMFSQAIYIANSRLKFLDEGALEGALLVEGFLLQEHLDRAAIDFDIRVRYKDNFESSFLSADTITLNKRIEVEGYDETAPQPPGVYGVAPLAGLLAARIQSACSQSGHEIVQDTVGKEGDGDESGNGTTEVTFYSSSGTFEQFTTEGYATEEHKKAIYLRYLVDSRYKFNPHASQCPYAQSSSDTDDSSVVISLARPTCKRIVKIEAERQGDWPTLPKPEPFEDENGIKYKVLGYDIEPSAPTKSADGKTKVHRTDCTIVWGMSRAPTTEEKLRSAALPWDIGTIEENSLDGSQAFKGISDSASIA